MADLGKLLIVCGIVLLLAGIVVVLLGRTGVHFGQLPGDFIYRGKNTTVYFPLATSVVVSLVLSVLAYVIGKLRR